MIGALKNDLNQAVVPLWHKDKDISMFSRKIVLYCPGV
jgi:phosphoribosylformylglycinamidine synthase